MEIGESTTRFIEKPRLKDPILIEGLPGVGNVGKLAAEHLIDEIGAKKFAEIYSTNFPPQVFINPDGTTRLVKNDLYYWKGKRDLIILTGDYQGLSPKGQYRLTDAVLDIAEEFGTKMIFTLGGYGMGEEIQNPRVTGAATDPELVNEMKKYGIIFKNEPGGGIVGASGLLLGMGKLRGIKGICLMGETSGYLVDPNSAKAVIKVLAKILKIDIDLSKLDRKAREIDVIASRIKEMETEISRKKEREKKEELEYIG
jgi:hypothetical protein